MRFVRTGPAAATFVVALATALLASSAAASPTVRPLDVPYVPQNGLLCGGASVAMVLRYWGEPRVYAEDFADLVEQDRSGIPTAALREAVERRGYRTTRFQGTYAELANDVSNGIPVVVLIGEGPDRYHYVVVVGFDSGRVVLHDPAGRPFQTMDDAAFERAWSAADHWALLILPSTAGRRAAATANPGENTSPRGESTSPRRADACAADVDEAVRIASTDLDRAESLLSAAVTNRCQESAAAWRELAGIRFLQKRWSEAAQLAERATTLDPHDEYAWRLLATSRFLQDDLGGALRAWNEVEAPRVDLTRVDGLTRTRYRVIADRLDLGPDSLLTEEKLRLATRRVSELPGITGSRVAFHPTTDQRADVDVAVAERPLAPLDGPALAGTALHALIDREVSATLASPTGQGELLTASWRWWEMRPQVAVSLAMPRLLRLPGVSTLEGSWERQTYGASLEPDALLVEERRHAGMRVADWFRSDLRWGLSAGIDRWLDRGAFLSSGASIERRLASDRVSLQASADWWSSLGSRPSFGTAAVDAAWRSSVERPLWTARAGVRMADTTAPRDLWPGAGTGQARTPLLRAHPLLESGIVRGPAFGPALAYGGLELHGWISRVRIARVGWAAFSDVGRAWNRPSSMGAAPLLVDLGAGLRIALPGSSGSLRLDAAHGVRDGAFAVSAGWDLPWPR